ncbi:MAG TPA: hypothetical protein VMS78_14405 [Rhizomicrobium sp.]|nr:hypothetical protein [Rhizomicrobium sp.]
MADSKKRLSQDKIHGEGNYAASRDYDKRTEKFISEKKSDIPKYAKDAEKALEGPEGKELKDAEEKGKAKARH